MKTRSIPVELPSMTSTVLITRWLKKHWHEDRHGGGGDFYEHPDGELRLECGRVGHPSLVFTRDRYNNLFVLVETDDE